MDEITSKGIDDISAVMRMFRIHLHCPGCGAKATLSKA
jgi:hypothetical protein